MLAILGHMPPRSFCGIAAPSWPRPWMLAPNTTVCVVASCWSAKANTPGTGVLHYSACTRPQDKRSRQEDQQMAARLACAGKTSGPVLTQGGCRADERPTKHEPPARRPGARVVHVAVTVGFEPTVACTTLAFEASSFGRSDTSPPMSVSQPGSADKFAGRSQPTTTSKVPTRSAIPAARCSIISMSWSRFRQLSGIPLRPYSAPASCP